MNKIKTSVTVIAGFAFVICWLPREMSAAEAARVFGGACCLAQNNNAACDSNDPNAICLLRRTACVGQGTAFGCNTGAAACDVGTTCELSNNETCKGPCP